MYVLHAHWQPPSSTVERGGVLFWAEASGGDAPALGRGRAAKKPKPRPHPFSALPGEVEASLGRKGKEMALTLRLPTTRSGPLPSPVLLHSWELDLGGPPLLAPWVVQGVWLPADEAFLALLELSGEQGQLVLAAETVFWQRVAALALEALGGHKIVPVMVQADAQGSLFQARWLPVLDGPKDAERLRRFQAAMPPVCRAEYVEHGGEPSPRALLNTFLNTICDAMARKWGRAPGLQIKAPAGPAKAWLEALFSDKPGVKAPAAQLQGLLVGQRAWLRNLHMAGDAAFRVAFRVEAPLAGETLVPAGQPGAGPGTWQIHYLLQARDDPSLLAPAEMVWNTRGNVLSELNRRFELPQEKLLAGLGYAARLFAPIGDSLKSKRPTHLEVDAKEVYTFLREAAPVLEDAGFGLLSPPWWNKPGARLGLRLKMSAPPVDAAGKSRMSMDKLVNYQWELALGETALTEDEFRALAALKSPLVQIRGQWVQLDPEQIEAAIRFWESQKMEGQMSLLEAAQRGIDSLLGQDVLPGQDGLPVDDVSAEGWLAEWLEQMRGDESVKELPQPLGLQGELRPYQRYGYSWLHFHRRWGLGACLADDMGLGKTIQTLALLVEEKETRGGLPAPTLLICPTSVVTNWEREMDRFAPGLVHMVHQGASRLRGDAFIQAVEPVDVVLTSYALARQDAETMQRIHWLGVILDEAQNIKNPEARQTQAVRGLQSGFRLALTGTPVENRLSELWSIMQFLNPGYLGSRKSFSIQFARPIERYNDEEALERLKNLTGPFILRRVKTDPRVIQDLPDKVETKVYCHLSEEQATLYEAVVQDAMKQIEENEGIQRRGMVLSMLMQLKQICNHPVQYLHQGKGAVEERSLVARSGKLERLLELMDEVLAGKERALIFTQFAEMGELLASHLPQALNTAVFFLHGGTPVKHRDQMVRRFQEDDSAPGIFILSLKAGGVGLNLTRASHVFHYDRWWNPAVENQATDRAFRIGQKRNVQVHKFVTVGTLEEMIDDMIESKRGLAQAVIGSGENWLTELSSQDLRQLVSLRREDAHIGGEDGAKTL